MRTRLFALVIMITLLTVVTVKSFAAETINFGIMSTESSQNLRPIWEPFLRDMTARTGLDIKPFFVSDYAGLIEGMRFNKVQIAWIGNKGATEAVDRAGAEVFAQTVASDGSAGYNSVIIAHVDSPLNSVDDMLAKGATLNFGNGDPNSTSGFLVPSYYVFAANKVDAKKIFKNMLTSNHESNALAVANKQLDAATCNTETLQRLVTTNPEKRKLLKVIWTSPLIPSDPLVWRKDMPEELKKTIAGFIFSYGVSGDAVAKDKAVLEALQWAPFRASSNDQLIPIRQLALFRDKSKLEADTAMNKAERDAKIADLDAKLAELDKALKKN